MIKKTFLQKGLDYCSELAYMNVVDMEKIINGRFFQEIIPQSWNVCTSTTNKRLDVCEATCADKFDAFTAQFAREDLT